MLTEWYQISLEIHVPLILSKRLYFVTLYTKYPSFYIYYELSLRT